MSQPRNHPPDQGGARRRCLAMLTTSRSSCIDMQDQGRKPDSVGEMPLNALRTSSKPHTLWLTGLSGSGKTTIAYTLKRRLLEDGLACHVLDGDTMRQGLNRDLGFSEEHRLEAVRRVAECAKAMNEAGLIVIVSMISPTAGMRAKAGSIIGLGNFSEVYVNTPIEVCEQRDPKGLYNQARLGKLPQFTGVSAAYESPVSPDVQIDGSKGSPEDSAALLFAALTATQFKV
jgi:adenylyl-sulfate kinase